MKPGKGRLQENDAPDLSDLEPSIPQMNPLSSTSNLFPSVSRAAPRNFSLSQSEPSRRDTSDQKESGNINSGSASELSSRKVPPTIDGCATDAAQEALINQIKAQAEGLERLRVNIIQNLQTVDDSLCDNADQVQFSAVFRHGIHNSLRIQYLLCRWILCRTSLTTSTMCAKFLIRSWIRQVNSIRLVLRLDVGSRLWDLSFALRRRSVEI